MRRRTLEEKLEAIRLVEEGNSPRSVTDRLHIGHHQIYEWLHIYKEKGVAGLANKRTSRKNRLSFEEKKNHGDSHHCPPLKPFYSIFPNFSAKSFGSVGKMLYLCSAIGTISLDKYDE